MWLCFIQKCTFETFRHKWMQQITKDISKSNSDIKNWYESHLIYSGVVKIGFTAIEYIRHYRLNSSEFDTPPRE